MQPAYDWVFFMYYLKAVNLDLNMDLAQHFRSGSGSVILVELLSRLTIYNFKLLKSAAGPVGKRSAKDVSILYSFY